MSQKPAHKRNPDESREAIWEAVRKLKRFTARDVWEITRCTRENVRDYLAGLTAAGHLLKRANRIGFPCEYELVRDNGIEAPKVRRDGTEVTLGKGRERIWTALGIKAQKGHRFNSADLAIHPEVDEGDVKHFLRFLRLAGYVQEVKKGSPGVRAIYRMPMDKWTGPKPPQVQRIRQLYDPNKKAVVWSEAEGGADGN